MNKKENKTKIINHIAIAVPNLIKAREIWKNALDCDVSEVIELRDHGVKTVFVTFSNIKIELLEPLGEKSPIEKFLKKNPKGGLHHVCCEVSNLKKAKSRVLENGVRILGDRKIKTGAHGKPIMFLNPSDFSGTLIELEEV